MKKRTALVDALILTALFVIALVLTYYFNWFGIEAVVRSFVIYSALRDLLFTGALLLSLGLAVYTWRRLRELRRETAERKQVQEALRRSQSNLAAAQRITRLGSWEWDLGTGQILWSDELYRIFGYSSQQFVPTYENFLGSVRSDDQKLVDSRVHEALHMGKPYNVEFRIVRQDGSERIVKAQAEMLLDGMGNPDRMIGTAQDITERKRAEDNLKSYASRLNQSNRELRDFAYVASHDLQEPLRKVRAFSDRLKAKYAEVLGEQGRDYLERMEGAASRMQDLIEDLLTLSRVTTEAQPCAPIDLNEVAQDVVSDLEERIDQLGGRVEVSGLPTVEADRAQMRQLLQNLIGNALKFHREDEAPVVNVYGGLVQNRKEEPNGGSVGDRDCQIFVEDNGIGFDEKHLERVLAPFQRLHGRDAYEGTGMGLAICRKVVERHNGYITAKSTPGQGATFIVTLPAKQPKGNL
jgi:PAS domain S-box-containing protein